MSQQVFNQVTDLRKAIRLWQKWMQQQYKTVASGKRITESDEPDTKELLISGELSNGVRKDVHIPKGFLAVYVGSEGRKFLIPTDYLSMPEFRSLLDRVAEEFGFEQEGAIHIPCEEEDFEEVLVKCLRTRRASSKKKL